MRTSEIIFGTMFMVLSAVFFALTFTFPRLTIALSPGVFPRFVTICLFILSSILLGQGILKHLKNHDEGNRGVTDRAYAGRFALVAAAAFFYTQAIRVAGYIVATPFFIAAVMLVFGEKKWYRIAIVSILSTAILYGLFRMVFRVPLPRFELW